MDHRVKPDGDEKWCLARVALGDATRLLLYRTGISIDVEGNEVCFGW